MILHPCTSLPCLQAGLNISSYRYLDYATSSLDMAGLLADLEAAEQGAVLVLQACSMNPSGIDPTPDQWRLILKVR